MIPLSMGIIHIFNYLDTNVSLDLRMSIIMFIFTKNLKTNRDEESKIKQKR